MAQGLESFGVRSRSLFGHPLYYLSTVFGIFRLHPTRDGWHLSHWGGASVSQSVVSLGTSLGVETAGSLHCLPFRWRPSRSGASPTLAGLLLLICCGLATSLRVWVDRGPECSERD